MTEYDQCDGGGLRHAIVGAELRLVVGLSVNRVHAAADRPLNGPGSNAPEAGLTLGTA